ncbi:MAG: thioredoxin-disulfide reductase [Bacteroidales bacterium]|nr:thioredoxin-disulfide reductase [Bacteroidales bacterium]
MEYNTKCLIIGSGPAGYTAAIYASRFDMHPLLYEGIQVGGQLTITTEVENFPGYPQGIHGVAMMDDIRQQALRFGTEMRNGEIVKADFSVRPFTCIDDNDNIIHADTVIIATGASARWLGLESEKKFNGYGVSACATCDGFFYKNKDVAVIGGGDTATEEASYLAKLCRKVYLVHRRDELRASKVMQQRVFNTANIEMVWNSVPIEIIGQESKFNKAVTGLKIQNTKTADISTLNVDGVFIAIGHHPNTDVFKGQVELDNEGYIVTRPGSSHTNIPGVFAAGDVQDKQYKQAITAAAGGCRAAIDAEHFLQENA